MRRSGQLGSTFLTGVDRRVHAPLGTVMKFSGLLTRAGPSRRAGRFYRVVRAGGRLLLRLIGSVLSLSGVRTKRVSFVCSRFGMSALFQDLCRAFRDQIGNKIALCYRVPRRSYIVCSRGGHLARIVAGFLAGTYGFAFRKSVHVKCGRERSKLCFCMGSAKGNVRQGGLPRMFRHFTGFSSFVRKAKLKLSVYRAVLRGLRKGVNMRSRRKGKDAF